MLNEPPSALLARADELLRADLLTEDNGLLAYRHDLIREAVRDTLPRTALRVLQRQAVDALLASGSPPVEVAAQLAASAEPGDQVAVRTLHEAARALGCSDALDHRALDRARLTCPRVLPDLLCHSGMICLWGDGSLIRFQRAAFRTRLVACGLVRAAR
jgi:hypothetical protein